MRNPLLQQVSTVPEKRTAPNGLALIFYVGSVIIAFFAGTYFERPRTTPVVDAKSSIETAATPDAVAVTEQPAQTAAVVESPSAAPAAAPIMTPGATARTPVSPVRIEKAIAISPSASSATPSPIVKQPGTVTVLQPVEIPVKNGLKVVGYINLQAGQQIVPVAVEKGQIKIKCGENFVYVPVKATDMHQ